LFVPKAGFARQWIRKDQARDMDFSNPAYRPGITAIVSLLQGGRGRLWNEKVKAHSPT